MPFTMVLNTVLDVGLLIIGCWIAIAGMVGVRRFGYWPLLVLSLGGVLLGASSLMDVLHVPYAHGTTRLALVSVCLFNLRYRATWKQHGITDRQLFFFTKG